MSKKQSSPIKLPESIGRRRFEAMNRAFRAEAKADEIELTIYDEIGFFGVTAKQIRQELDARPKAKRITLNINSPGGDVFDGVAIYNDLKAHPGEVTVRVTGLAASAASIIAMAGDRVIMAKNAFMMIHNAWGITIGDKADMQHMSGLLAQIDEALMHTYADRTGQSQRRIREMMDAETWLTAEESEDMGFSDETEDAEAKAQALFDLSLYAKVPGQLKRQIEDGLRDAGYSKREAVEASCHGFHALTRGEPASEPRRGDPGEAEPRDEVEVLENLRHKLAA